MSTKPDPRLYENDAMDREIERDVEELQMLMKDVTEPEEPHPAYWNNFLLRVHERVEEEIAPKRKAWWSPALIWGSLTGVALLLVAAWFGGVFPFGSGPDENASLLALNDVPAQEEPDLTPRPLDEDLLTMPIEDDEAYNLVLTQDDVDMLNAIQADDEEAILLEMIDEMDIEI